MISSAVRVNSSSAGAAALYCGLACKQGPRSGEVLLGFRLCASRPSSARRRFGDPPREPRRGAREAERVRRVAARVDARSDGDDRGSAVEIEQDRRARIAEVRQAVKRDHRFERGRTDFAGAGERRQKGAIAPVPHLERGRRAGLRLDLPGGSGAHRDRLDRNGVLQKHERPVRAGVRPVVVLVPVSGADLEPFGDRVMARNAPLETGGEVDGLRPGRPVAEIQAVGRGQDDLRRDEGPGAAGQQTSVPGNRDRSDRRHEAGRRIGDLSEMSGGGARRCGLPVRDGRRERRRGDRQNGPSRRRRAAAPHETSSPATRRGPTSPRRRSQDAATRRLA